MCNPSTGAGDSLEYDAESETYRAEFDSTEVDPSVAVVDVIAQILDKEPTQFDPLQEYIDMASLDQLCRSASSGRQQSDCRIGFMYIGFDVIVKSYGKILVTPSFETNDSETS